LGGAPPPPPPTPVPGPAHHDAVRPGARARTSAPRCACAPTRSCPAAASTRAWHASILVRGHARAVRTRTHGQRPAASMRAWCVRARARAPRTSVLCVRARARACMGAAHQDARLVGIEGLVDEAPGHLQPSTSALGGSRGLPGYLPGPPSAISQGWRRRGLRAASARSRLRDGAPCPAFDSDTGPDQPDRASMRELLGVTLGVSTFRVMADVADRRMDVGHPSHNRRVDVGRPSHADVTDRAHASTCTQQAWPLGYAFNLSNIRVEIALTQDAQLGIFYPHLEELQATARVPGC
jgi:hypothetical protein